MKNMNNVIGKYIIIIGLCIVIIGLLIYFLGDKLHWIGRLPGDIRVEKENVKFYFPIASMIIISILLTLLINLFKRIF